MWDGRSSSGASHGGLGGRGSHGNHAPIAYDSVLNPIRYGGAGSFSSSKTIGGEGGGIVTLKARNEMEIDGLISVDGTDAQTVGLGGGAGGSIQLVANNFKGKTDLILFLNYFH